MPTQSRVVPALAALHNFIMDHDNEDLAEYRDASDAQRGTYPDPEAFGTLATQITNTAEQRRAEARRDRIAEEMWEDYQNLLVLGADYLEE
jgi:hypothetical protein